jgi:hypothetical protein
MRLDLAGDPDVISIAAACELSEDYVVGLLHKLWSWANKHTTDGNAPGVTLLWIDRYVGVTGFATALVTCAWLEETAAPSWGVRFPNFSRHNGQSAKRRALAANRAQVHRNGRSVTKALPEKRREEKRRKGETPLPPLGLKGVQLPEGLDTKRFREAWAEWSQYRTDLRKPLTRLGRTKQLKYLGRIGEVLALETIEHTIRQGYVGLLKPKPEDAPAETIDVEAGVDLVRAEVAQQGKEAAAEPWKPMAARIAAVLKGTK